MGAWNRAERSWWRWKWQKWHVNFAFSCRLSNAQVPNQVKLLKLNMHGWALFQLKFSELTLNISSGNSYRQLMSSLYCNFLLFLYHFISLLTGMLFQNNQFIINFVLVFFLNLVLRRLLSSESSIRVVPISLHPSFRTAHIPLFPPAYGNRFNQMYFTY